jgi:hypothetical protein
MHMQGSYLADGLRSLILFQEIIVRVLIWE